MGIESDASDYEPQLPSVPLVYPRGGNADSLGTWLAEQMLACPTEPDEDGNVWDKRLWAEAVWSTASDWMFDRFSSDFIMATHLKAQEIYSRDQRRANSRWWQFWR